MLQRAALGLRAEVLRVDRAVALADRVAADDQRDGLLVVHRHPAEGLADVPGGGQRVRVAVGPLRVHVDQAHLHGAERTGELAVAAVALVAEPGVLGPPEDLLGLPDVLAPEAEAERLEPHRLVGAVAGEDEQVGPGDLPAVLLLDRPEQPARLVEAHVVGPAVERGEALGAAAATAAAVGDAVRARGVPAHPDEQRPVVAVVGRPPVLRGRHQLEDVALQRLDVEGLELLRVVEVLAHRVGLGRVLVQNREVELVRPPVLVRPRPVRSRASGRGLPGSRSRGVTSVFLLSHCFLWWGGATDGTAGAGARESDRGGTPRSLVQLSGINQVSEEVRKDRCTRPAPPDGGHGRIGGVAVVRPQVPRPPPTTFVNGGNAVRPNRCVAGTSVAFAGEAAYPQWFPALRRRPRRLTPGGARPGPVSVAGWSRAAHVALSGGMPPVAIGPQRSMVIRSRHLLRPAMAARYSFQSGCSPAMPR